MITLLFTVFGCGESKSIDEDSSSTVPENDHIPDDSSSIEEQEAIEVFRVPERPWDLIEGPNNTLYCSTQGGNKVYIWDLLTETRTQYPHSVPDVQNLYFDEDTLFFTNTDNGVTGSLSKMNGNQRVELYSQADDGFLMRWPMDIIRPSTNDGWIIADYAAGVLFVVDEQERVSVHDAGSTRPQSLLLVDSILYIAGEDGIFSIEWPDGEPTLIDERAGLGLENINGQIWSSNSTLGLFEVAGEPIGLYQAARPGNILHISDQIYFVDHVGEGVWLYRL